MLVIVPFTLQIYEDLFNHTKKLNKNIKVSLDAQLSVKANDTSPRLIRHVVSLDGQLCVKQSPTMSEGRKRGGCATFVVFVAF